MDIKVIRDKCKKWCSDCKAFDWAHCTEKYEVEKPIENAQIAPKEIWVGKVNVDRLSNGYEIENDAVLVAPKGLTLINLSSFYKYISEVQVKELLVEKDNALRLASEKLLQALNETISVESNYKLYRERTTGHIKTLNNEIEELRSTLRDMLGLYLNSHEEDEHKQPSLSDSMRILTNARQLINKNQ